MQSRTGILGLTKSDLLLNTMARCTSIMTVVVAKYSGEKTSIECNSKSSSNLLDRLEVDRTHGILNPGKKPEGIGQAGVSTGSRGRTGLEAGAT